MELFLLVVMKKSFLIVLSLLLITFSIKCQSIFDYSLNQFLNDESVENSSISIQLINGSSREVLMEYNSEKLLIPASIQKLFTTTYALKQLGENYKFKTIAYSSGFTDLENQKLIGGQKCFATFHDFSFWALPDQKMAGSEKNWWQNFSTIIVLV